MKAYPNKISEIMSLNSKKCKKRRKTEGKKGGQGVKRGRGIITWFTLRISFRKEIRI